MRRLTLVGLLAFFLAPLLPARAAEPPVTLTRDDAGFTLANGHVTARVEARSGTFSLKFGDLPVIERGYWSQVGRNDAGGDIGRVGGRPTAAVRVDPAANDGARAEVSCRFAYDGKSPGLPCDVDIRYALARGDAGLYAYAVWEHKPGYPGFSVGEGRMAFKLNPAFDFLAIDERRIGPLPSGADWDKGEVLNMKEVRRIKTGPLAGRVEHKYDYSAILGDTPAYGWASTSRHVGAWLINPSIEYLGGGPTKVELTAHLDVNPGGAPTLLNMWHGSHYGGSALAVAADEQWSKCIGPFLIYCNGGAEPRELWQQAQAKGLAERAAWPYGWVDDPTYPRAEQRATVTGTIKVVDPLAPKLDARNMQVGLAWPAEPARGNRGGAPVDWQRDSKHYEYWTKADANGRFSIPNVRPGSYALSAFADGVLGEFTRSAVNVAAPGQPIDLGEMTWVPVRHGRQIWEIGTPDRAAAEFRHGDDYWHWGLYYDYAKEFPHDVNFVIGRSDPRTDWNFCQPPLIDGNRVTPSTWSITFDLPQAPPAGARATLRLAIAGSRLRGGIAVAANGKPAGDTGPLPDTGVMHRDGIRGYWCERAVPFDAALLKPGANVLTLTPPAQSWVNGVLYDYLRLELEDTPKPAQ